MAQRDPSLQEALTQFHNYTIANMYTGIPGIIVSVVDMGRMIVNVQPTINIRSDDGLLISERPPILNVPLVMPVGLQGGLTFPVQPGQPVWLSFSMRGMDAWKASNGYPNTPLDMRTFDVRDCVAELAIYPGSRSPNDPSARTLSHNPEDVVLVHNIGSGNEVEIRLKAGGGVEINAPGQEVKVVCNTALVEADSSVTLDTPETNLTGNLTVEGTMDILGTSSGSGLSTIHGNFDIVGTTLQHNGKNIGSTHTHTGVQSGGDISGPPA